MLGDVLLIEEKHHQAAAAILEYLDKNEEEKSIIAISGESGSGKSEVAHLIARGLKDNQRLAKVMHIDNYYLVPPVDRTQWRKEHGFKSIGLDEYNWDLINENISQFLAGQKSTMPCIDLLTDQIDQLTTDFSDIPFLIVEGLYAVNVNADLRVFIDLTYLETKKAQQLRGKEPQNEFRLNVLKREHEVVQSLRPLANLIINKDYQVVFSSENL
jgi:uridine kinase